MSHYIDVKFRVDGVNVFREDGCKMPYVEEIYPSRDGWSVLIDVETNHMIEVLKDMGYEVKIQEVMEKS